MINIAFPRWQFPNNLGDSMVFTFVPKVVAKITGEKVNVLSDRALGKILEHDPNIDNLEFEPRNKSYSVIQPVWHPEVFKKWGEKYEFFYNHPGINVITLNYCLQLGIEKYLTDDSIDFTPEIYGLVKDKNTKPKIGIAPATKLSGKPSPHPSCNGLGFRFNGERGYESWETLVRTVKDSIDCEIVEFSPKFLGLGDSHIGLKDSLYDLAKETNQIDFGITTDGGYHNLFNALKKPLVLFTGSKASKPEFFKLGNAFYPDHLHLSCRFKCPSYFLETFGGEDLSLNCKLECERMDPVLLAEYTIEKIKLCME